MACLPCSRLPADDDMSVDAALKRAMAQAEAGYVPPGGQVCACSGADGRGADANAHLCG